MRPDRYIEINNFYTATVYNKGAEVVRMLQTLLGREGFRKGMDLYFERHDGQAATVEDFVTCFEDATGRDLQQFMTWYSQAGTPELVCQLKYDARTKTADLTIAQVLPPTPGEAKKKPLHVPVRLGLLGGNGQDIDLTLASGKRLRGRRHRGHQAHRDLPLPRRALAAGAVAAARLLGARQPDDRPHSDADLQFLMANDSDLYNRWQAAQDYATRVLVDAVKALRAGKRPAKPQAFVAALGVTLDDESLDPGYRAQFMFLPSESDLARVIGRDVDPLAIHKARKELRKAIGTMLYDALADIYRKHEAKGPYSPAPEAAGKRALRNAALGYLTCRGQAEDVARVAAHFANARNATDEVSALADALRAALARAGQGLRPLLRALEGRPPRHRQLVRLPGRLAAAVRRSPRW